VPIIQPQLGALEYQLESELVLLVVGQPGEQLLMELEHMVLVFMQFLAALVGDKRKTVLHTCGRWSAVIYCIKHL